MALTRTLKLLSVLIFTKVTTSKFLCPGTGFYPDPASCTSFYRCVDLDTSYKYLCPAGTRYDPTLSNCNHEASAPPCNVNKQDKPSKKTTRKPETKATTRKPATKATTRRPATKPSTRNPFIIIRPNYTTQNVKTTTPSKLVPDLPVFPPPLSTPIPEKATPSNTPPNLIVTTKPLPSRNYSVSPISLYACPQPDFYAEETSCEQFYTCRETSPGVLSADRIFRCPNGYMFDSKTHLCQLEDKVTCQKDKSEPFLFYTVLNALVVQLKESQLQQFFSSRLQLPIPRPKTVINPKVHVFGDDENPYPWVIFQSSIHK